MGIVVKVYLEQNVFDAALNRIRRLFNEFEHINVSMSGGKDSTVVMQLALIVAEELGRLPLKVSFLDQEAEWDATIQYIRSLQDDPRIDFDWLQVPFRIFNASSTRDPWLHCWREGDTWLREKEPDSIHDNIYGEDRFKKMLNAHLYTTFPEGGINLTGVRAQESPARMKGLTGGVTYQDITWGSKLRRGYYSFHPIYDWEISDVWKFIHDNGFRYNRLYDYMWQYGIPIYKMRVSNINHEQALKDLFFLQEIEPETWEKVTARMHGINTVGQLKEQFYAPKTLPFMFASWREYRDHLLEKLITDPDIKAEFLKRFEQSERLFIDEIHDKLLKVHIEMILVNDYHSKGAKLTTFTAANAMHVRNRGRISGHNRRVS